MIKITTEKTMAEREGFAFHNGLKIGKRQSINKLRYAKIVPDENDEPLTEEQIRFNKALDVAIRILERSL